MNQRMVMCRKYNKELPGLANPPFPGPAGQDIYDTISQQAWTDWMNHQTLLINEKRLNMMDASSRKYLAEQRVRFFSGESVDEAEGYVPPTE